MEVIFGTVAIVGALVAVGVLIDRHVVSIVPRREDLAADPRHDHAPGTAASAALVCGPRRRRRLLRRQRCTCGAAMAAAGEDTARLGERDLLVVRLGCRTCGAERTLYFVR